MEQTAKENAYNTVFKNSELWMNEAHKMIEKQLGEDWKEKYVVWDCECNLKEFTKNHEFEELYSSSQNADCVVLSNKYNKNSDCFQFDFLNDSIKKIEEFCPELQAALMQNRPIVFFVNPFNYKAGLSDLTNNHMNRAMDIGGMSIPKTKAYSQYIYRIKMMKTVFDLSEAHIFVFGFSDFICNSNFRSFRQNIFHDFSFERSFIFPGSELNKYNTEQGVVFLHLNGIRPGRKTHILSVPKKAADHQVIDMPEIILYNLDQEVNAYEWVRSETEEEQDDLPQMTLSFKVTDHGYRGVEGQMASICFGSNTIMNNRLNVFSLPSTVLRSKRVPVLKSNWNIAIPIYAARRCVDRDWKNWHLEYRMPNMLHDNWEQFVADSIVYFMFDERSKIASLEINYNGRKYSLRNHFFFMDPSDLLPAFKGSGFDDFFKDYVESDTPYFYRQIEQMPLSPIAEQLLAKAKNMTIDSANTRIKLNKKYPELQLHRWDAGYAQLKKVWKKNDKKSYREFQEVFSKFRSHMRKRTYQLEFLM